MSTEPLIERVVRFETRFVVQCQSDDGDWYDYGVYVDKNEAKSHFDKISGYRKGAYRLVWRTTRDVMICRKKEESD